MGADLGQQGDQESRYEKQRDVRPRSPAFLMLISPACFQSQ